MLPEDYKVRCDKHQFKPYEYCEMCMVRSYLQDSIETNRKDTRATLGATHLAISVINDTLIKHEKQIEALRKAMED